MRIFLMIPLTGNGNVRVRTEEKKLAVAQNV
jgi:hypothetical protein